MQRLMKFFLAGAIASSAFSQSLAPSPIRNAEQPITTVKTGKVPSFVLPEIYKDRVKYPLPPSHNNAVNSPYFNPYDPSITGLWRQSGYSCANAQSVCCLYNHEANKLRDFRTPAGASKPEYTYHYTFHFLNDGDASDGGDAWMFFEAFDILKETGGATTADWGGWDWGKAFLGWMSGYEKYYRAMKMRVDEYYDLNANDASADEAIKQVLYDHANGSKYGSNLVFRAAGGTKTTVDGKKVCMAFKADGNHALSIVGWDDTFLPGGSWIIHNTHADGLFYVPRSQLKPGSLINYPGVGVPVVFPRLRIGYRPQLTFKITLTHPVRNNIAVMTGVGGPTSTQPAVWKDYAGAFNYSGGAFPMGGRAQSSTLEFGLDLTDFARNLTAPGQKLYLMVFSKGGVGTINSVSLMDYRNGETPVETPLPLGTGMAITAGIASAPALTTVSLAWPGTLTPVAIRERTRESGLDAIWRPAGSVRIRMTAEAASQATLNIRDLGGRSVYDRSLTLSQRAGSYVELPWNLHDRQGGRVAPGLYFATVDLREGGKLVQQAATEIRIME